MYVYVQVVWQPYLEVGEVDQPWVEAGRPYYGRNIYLHCQNEIIFLLICKVVRTLGFFQGWQQYIYMRPYGVNSRGVARRPIDWRQRFPEPYRIWGEKGVPVETSAPSNTAYLRRYQEEFGETFARRLQEVSFQLLLLVALFFVLIVDLLILAGSPRHDYSGPPVGYCGIAEEAEGPGM